MYKCVHVLYILNLFLATAPLQTLDVVDAMVPPKFVKPINAVEAKKGGSAHFVVEFDGSPQPDVTWFREGHAIQSSNDFQIVQVRVSVLNPTQFSLPPSLLYLRSKILPSPTKLLYPPLTIKPR